MEGFSAFERFLRSRFDRTLEWESSRRTDGPVGRSAWGRDAFRFDQQRRMGERSRRRATWVRETARRTSSGRHGRSRGSLDVRPSQIRSLSLVSSSESSGSSLQLRGEREDRGSRERTRTEARSVREAAGAASTPAAPASTDAGVDPAGQLTANRRAREARLIRDRSPMGQFGRRSQPLCVFLWVFSDLIKADDKPRRQIGRANFSKSIRGNS